jgi:hypothetical protein
MFNDPGDPDGLVRTRGGRMIHRGDCRYVAPKPGWCRDADRLPPSRWEWADGRAFAEIRQAAAAHDLRRCTVCKPAEGDGQVRSAGPWSTPFNAGHANPLHTIVRDDGATLVFDPPNILFVPGGARMRIESFETDAPVLAVERFNRTIERYRMLAVLPVVH